MGNQAAAGILLFGGIILLGIFMSYHPHNPLIQLLDMLGGYGDGE